MTTTTRTLRTSLFALLLVASLAGCTREQRQLAADQPATPPNAGAEDPRVAYYQNNFHQQSQGGRYFVWYGCANCHVDGGPPALDLTDRRWRHGEAFAAVYGYIGHGHQGIAPYDALIPTEQLWQITAYVRELPYQDANVRRRRDADLAGEPRAQVWSGARR